MNRQEMIKFIEDINNPLCEPMKNDLLSLLRNEDIKFLGNPNWHNSECIKANIGSCICK